MCIYIYIYIYTNIFVSSGEERQTCSPTRTVAPSPVMVSSACKRAHVNLSIQVAHNEYIYTIYMYKIYAYVYIYIYRLIDR